MGQGFIVWLSSSINPTEIAGWIFYVFTSPLPFRAGEHVEGGEIWFNSYNSKVRKQIKLLFWNTVCSYIKPKWHCSAAQYYLVIYDIPLYTKFSLEKAVFVRGTHYKWLLWMSNTLNHESLQTVLHKESVVINRKRGFINKLLFIAGQQ